MYYRTHTVVCVDSIVNCKVLTITQHLNKLKINCGSAQVSLHCVKASTVMSRTVAQVYIFLLSNFQPSGQGEAM